MIKWSDKEERIVHIFTDDKEEVIAAGIEG